MQRLTYLCILAILCIACQSTSEPTLSPIQISPVREISPWQPLFNGKDLIGWEQMGNFTTDVKNNILYIKATEPYNNAWLLTKKAYRNFKWEGEFYMPDTTTNSGILFRHDSRKPGHANHHSYEIDLDWRLSNPVGMGSIEKVARAKGYGKAIPNQWQKIQFEANYDQFQVFLNDQLVGVGSDRTRSVGRIALQVPVTAGDEIAFRNIRIQQLPDTSALKPTLEDRYRNSTQPLTKQFTTTNLDGWQTLGPGTWEIENGVLHGYSGADNTYLVSEKSYKNFYLKCAFKIKKEDNSGIFIRKHPDSTNLNPINFIECNIYDHKDFTHAYSTGSIVTHARAFFGLIDYENWNEMEIFAEENHVILTINGKKSAETYLPERLNNSGQICLQAGTRVFSDKGPSDIYFKDLMIREME